MSPACKWFPFLSTREGKKNKKKKKKNYLNSLMPLSGIRYNQSGEWVGKQDEGPAEIKQKPHHGCSKNKINPFIQLEAAQYSKGKKNELDESFSTNLHPVFNLNILIDRTRLQATSKSAGLKKQISQSDWVARHIQSELKICKTGYTESAALA